MKSTLTPLDRVAWSVMALLGLALILVYALGNRVPLQVKILPADGQTGGRGPLRLEFSQPVEASAFEALAGIQPALPGQWVWDNPQQAQFWPTQPLLPDTRYRLTIQGGRAGVNGERIEQPAGYDFRARQPEIVYRPAGSGQDDQLFAVDLAGKTRQLTRVDGEIFDYAVSPDGERVIFSVINDQMGVDFWLIMRDGSQQRRWLNCGTERCTAPAWSPDGKRLVYSRQSQGLSPTEPLGPPRPWLADLASGQTAPLLQDSQVLGYGPLWSPDGQRIAFFNGLKGGIEVVELQTRAQIFLASTGGKVGSWSPDGSSLTYHTVEAGPNGPRSVLYQMDFKAGTRKQILAAGPAGNTGKDLAYEAPLWAPQGQQLAIGMRQDPATPDRQIWLTLVSQTAGGQTIYRPGYALSGYQWDPWGTALAFQAQRLGGMDAPEIMVWQAAGETLLHLASGSGPIWLP